MRHGTSNNRRHRNRNSSGRRASQQSRTQVYDSNGPDVRIRGTAHQVAEKYLALAKDAASAGDHMIAENYYQHAEHYIRIINEISGNAAEKVRGLSSPRHIADDEGNKIENAEDLGLPVAITGCVQEANTQEIQEAKQKQTAEAIE